MMYSKKYSHEPQKPLRRPETLQKVLGETKPGKDKKPSVIDTQLAAMIDHTLLKPDASDFDVQKLCAEAVTYGFKTVCVNSSNIPLAAKCLAGSSVMPIAVVGFPLGASTPSAKAYESREAISAGAKEIDMVINIGALKSKDYETVFLDIQAVVEASGSVPVKVILETSKISDEEKIIGCVLAKIARAAFVKTSTGFGGGGATIQDIQLMRRIVGSEMGVKASGGVRSRDEALALIKAGATRVGASSSVEMVTGGQGSGGY
jgi:deoxyribose-phosphate aldolase